MDSKKKPAFSRDDTPIGFGKNDVRYSICSALHYSACDREHLRVFIDQRRNRHMTGYGNSVAIWSFWAIFGKCGYFWKSFSRKKFVYNLSLWLFCYWWLFGYFVAISGHFCHFFLVFIYFLQSSKYLNFNKFKLFVSQIF